MSDFSPRDKRLRRYWDRQAGSYDRQMAVAERRFFGDTRSWLCGQAVGDTLEVAIGTGLNLAHYPGDVRLTGVEWSDSLLAVAQRRADDLGRAVDLRRGDARALRFADGRFDTVVCTFSLCAMSDERVVLAEMARVLRPGGLLLLADHVASSSWPVRALQGLLDAVTVPLAGEHFRRRPVSLVRAMGFTVERHDRFKLGVIERFAARKPVEHAAPGQENR
ncbi:class I SAM-dependent methyltransferase [Sphaerisporangium sp. TRM90804]|uniref:class I SAM-dependent methyltransferase n=1 Tax=Sphaerisporangium sp. TRM90804 TaxID=3031113 RepID=UPI002448770D|nr:class I SAM-dependent methyltransferase [Sphaerisporangium sp. TRM90804]MDH2428301.1 class I SAM-dependent methyltransferase [Sphaerisporangium sp. TRM90804]